MLLGASARAGGRFVEKKLIRRVQIVKLRSQLSRRLCTPNKSKGTWEISRVSLSIVSPSSPFFFFSGIENESRFKLPGAGELALYR